MDDVEWAQLNFQAAADARTAESQKRVLKKLIDKAIDKKLEPLVKRIEALAFRVAVVDGKAE
jgi:hypothetical protein